MNTSASLNDERRQELREQNLQWFQSAYPQYYNQFQEHRSTSELIDEGQGWFNIRFSGQTLYEPSAQQYVTEQLDAFWRKQNRIVMYPPQPNQFDHYASNCVHSTIERISAEGIEFATFVPTTKAYYAIVFGLGLGAHIQDIIEKSECQLIIIIEPNLDFLYQSLEVIDWAEIQQTLSDRGGNLSLVVSDNQEVIFDRIKHDVRLTNPCSYDGTLLYTHYQNSVFNVINQRLKTDANLILSGLGFYFDETVMIANTHENLRHGDAEMIRFCRHTVRHYPVIIVGSGPSLDKEIEWLKKNQDKAVIVSCGTAILPLKRHGIEPDFQVEIENIPELFEENEIQKKYIDFSNTHLLATTTIDARVPKLYGRTSYYFRPALSSYPLFARPADEPLQNGSPTVVNAGLALAQNFGFREFYFLGVDMGSKVEGLAHSKHAWQNTDEGAEVDIKFNIPIRGNFGGKVYTYGDLSWTRQELEAAIKHFYRGRMYYNCSDGAYIKGATAKHSRSVRLAEQPIKKSAEIKKITDAFEMYSREDFLEHWTDERIRDAIEEYTADLIACYQDIDNVLSKRALTDINKLLVARDESGFPLGLAMIFRGSVWQALLAQDYYASRINDEKDVLRGNEIIKQELENLVNHLRELSLEDLGHLSEQEWRPRPRQKQAHREEWGREG